MTMSNNDLRKKVGVITLDGNFNYGNRLQLYATTKIYKDLGFDVENLVLDSKKPVSIFDILLDRISLSGGENPSKLSSEERLASFLKFNSLIPRRIIRSIRDIDVDDYDWFSVGSDQVWNPGMIRDRSKASWIGRVILTLRDRKWSDFLEKWYFLGFCKPSQRIALSPSIGIDQLDPKQRRLLKQGMRNFDRASVREERGADLICEITGVRPTVICDPTLVIRASQWRDIANDRLVPSKPYIFTYLLGGMSEEAQHAIDLICQDRNYEIVHLSDRQQCGEPNAGPADFISLIDNASHVVTDSFHSSVFSSILETPLTIVRRNGGASMFSRLESLAHSLGIEHMVYGSESFDISMSKDFSGVANAITRERINFYTYLLDRLGLGSGLILSI